MKHNTMSTRQRIAGGFFLSLIGGIIGFQLGSYGDLVLNIDSRLVGAAFGAIVGNLLLRQITEARLTRSIITGLAAGAPVWYLVVQNRAIACVAVAVMLSAAVAYLVFSSGAVVAMRVCKSKVD